MNFKSISIPKSECVITYSRSGGKGGQNVNKRETKTTLHWNIRASGSFGYGQKKIIKAYAPLANKISENGDVVLYHQSERTQGRNKALLIEKLNRLVSMALTPPAKRVATKIPRSSRESRIRDKKATGKKKSVRGKVRDWE